jgi:uncharacterized ferritin-like protein (DUF455 family)
MTRALRERLPVGTSVREPPYRSVTELSEDERKALAAKLGSVQNYNGFVLREMARKDRRFLAPLIMSILSAEFRGIDFFGRFTVETQEHNVPWHMTMAFARQTYDESRHTQLNMQLLESLGSTVGEYPDIILGPQRGDEIPPEELDPAILLARINVALEGFALTTFEEIRALAEETGEELVEHCHDYNMADEVTHVAIGDYWLEKLSQEQPWRKERAARAQQEFEGMMAMVRQMAMQYAGSAAGPSSTSTPSSNGQTDN